MSPIVINRRQAADPYAKRKKELSQLDNSQLQALIMDLEAANHEKQKINQKYASQVKEMMPTSSAAQARNQDYENNSGVPSASKKFLRNYESMPSLEARAADRNEFSSR